MAVSFVKKNQLYFIASFAAMALFGTLLLKIPAVWRGDGALPWIDALFSSTSAVCVTGLTVVKVSDFTLLGQLLILFLVQLGGLGIMSISASLILLMGRNLSIGNTMLVSDLVDRISQNGVESLLRTILAYTFAVEFAGFLLLLPGFLCDGHSLGNSLYYAFFHAVSGFCNAGLSPFDDSLEGANSWIKLVVVLLFSCGGLGVYVVYDLRMRLTHGSRLRVHTKLALATSAVLIVGGTLALYLSELSGASALSWIDALFQATSSRTAGFNSVPIESLNSSSIAIIIILMQIGASPGSTGGGLRTTTVGLAFMAILSAFRGRDRVLMFKREIPTSNVLRAFSIIVTYMLAVYLGAVVIQMSNSALPFQWSFFEASSALGTVGLALRAPELTDVAKLIVTGMMFLGRVGLFTFMLFLLGRSYTSRLQYPQENVILN